MSERYNPWSVVNAVFAQLASEGLHPVLGEAGDPSVPAGELLRALGIEPGDPQWRSGPVSEDVQAELAEVRAHFTPVDPPVDADRS